MGTSHAKDGKRPKPKMRKTPGLESRVRRGGNNQEEGTKYWECLGMFRNFSLKARLSQDMGLGPELFHSDVPRKPRPERLGGGGSVDFRLFCSHDLHFQRVRAVC